MEVTAADRERISTAEAAEARRQVRLRQEARSSESRRERASGDGIRISEEAARRLEQDRSEDHERES